MKHTFLYHLGRMAVTIVLALAISSCSKDVEVANECAKPEFIEGWITRDANPALGSSLSLHLVKPVWVEGAEAYYSPYVCPLDDQLFPWLRPQHGAIKVVVRIAVSETGGGE